jgi:ABC-2 type transport system permease protein
MAKEPITMFKLFWVELTKRRTAIIGWGLGLFAYAAMIMALTPELTAQFGMMDLASISIYAAMGITGDFATVSSLLSMYIPFMGLMTAVYALITGTNALSGDEESGTLENMLTLPLPRYRIVIAKALAVSVALAIILFISFLGYAIAFLAIQDQIDSPLTLNDLFLGSMEAWPLCFAFAMLGMLFGAFLPRRIHALMLGLIVLIASYFINNLANIIDMLESIRPIALFHYYSGGAVLTEGIVVNDMLVLVGVGLVALLLTLLSFQHRDVTVGQWPWQRRQIADG